MDCRGLNTEPRNQRHMSDSREIALDVSRCLRALLFNLSRVV